MICPACDYDNVPGNEFCARCQYDLTRFDRPEASCPVERSLMQDQAGAVCTHAPKKVLTTTTVGEAIEAMLRDNVGALLVVDEHGNLQGIFSERDLLKKVAGIEKDFASLPVTRFMTPRPESVRPGATLSYVLNKMAGGDYRHVPIVQNGKPIGIISVRDMLRHLTMICETQPQRGDPARPQRGDRS